MATSTFSMVLKEHGHLVAPIGIITIVFLILVPLPGEILDLFFTINIVMSIGVLLISTYVKDPVDFSVYPSILLMATIPSKASLQ